MIATHLGEVFSGPQAELDALGGQLDALHTYLPDAGVHGTLGRHIIMASYDTPGLAPLDLRHADGTLRDLDLMALCDYDAATLPEAVRGPHEPDTYISQFVQVDEDNRIWLVFLDDPSIRQEVTEPDVFALVERHIGDLTVRTLGIHTQARLNGQLFGAPLRKHLPSFAQFAKFMKGLTDADLQPGDRRLPDSAYEPFDRFHAAVKQKYPRRALGIRLWDIHQSLPVTVQGLLRPLTRPFRAATLPARELGLPKA